MATYRNNLATIRHACEKTQQEVADAVGITVTGYQNYEWGKRDIKGTTLIALSKFFGCSVNEILCLETTADAPTNGKHESRNVISVDEWAIIDSYRNLDKEHQELVDSLLEIFERDSRRGKS